MDKRDLKIEKRSIENKKKKFKMPHVYMLLMSVMLIVIIMSWFVPAGEFGMLEDPNTGRMVVDPSNFNYISEVDPITVMDFFTAIHNGIVQSGDIIIMLLLAVGAIALVQKSGAIGAGIHKLLEASAGKELAIISGLTLIFAILGAIGMGEGGLPFIPLAVSVVTALGYDKMTGVATAMAGMGVGFASGVLNLFTTGISQSLIGLPIYSGITFRAGALVIFYIITVIYIINYAKKTRKDPSKSVVASHYINQLENARETEHQDKIEFTINRKLALLGLVFVFVFQAFGAIKLGWGLPQISALYLMFAFFTAIVSRMKASQACVDFAKGASNVLPAAFAIGLARSVMVLMNQAKIIDTAIYSLGQILQGKGPITIIFLVYISVIVFNFFVISGSGKAVILMPILSPLGKMVNINQQIMVLIYNYGDGFTNYIWPTSGGLIAGLTMVDVEWEEWAKFSAKLWMILSVVAFGIIVFANYINLGPF